MVVDEYRLRPQERPATGGSAAHPDHSPRRRAACFVIGVLVAVTGGFSSALLVANLPQIQGAMGMTPVEGGWLLAAWSATNVCIGMLLVRIHQQFGLRQFTRFALLGLAGLSALQIFLSGHEVALLARAASGMIGATLPVLGIFYILRAMPPNARLGGLMLGFGITQIALPLAWMLAPILLWNGALENLFLFELGLGLAVLAAVSLVSLPSGTAAKAFEKLDLLTLALFAPGIALLSAILVQGRIVWWSTPWIGQALAGAVVLIGAALLVEHNRANPLLNTRWIASGAMLRLVALAAIMRVLLSEPSHGATGLLAMSGMGGDQLVLLYGLAALAAIVGLIASLIMLDPADLLQPVVFSVGLIAVAACMAIYATHPLRPVNLYLGQSLIAFAALYCMGPVMMRGLSQALSRGSAHIISFAALFSIAQTLGGLSGGALLDSMRIVREKFHAARLADAILAGDPMAVDRLSVGSMIADPALLRIEAGAMLRKLVAQEANILASDDIFLLVAFLATVAFVALGGQWLYCRLNGINPTGVSLAALQKKRMEEIR